MRAGCDIKSIFKRNSIGLNSEFSSPRLVAIPRLMISLPYYLLIAEERLIGFITFARVLALCEVQIVSFRIWTLVAVSVSYDGNHCTTNVSILISWILLYASSVFDVSQHPSSHLFFHSVLYASGRHLCSCLSPFISFLSVLIRCCHPDCLSSSLRGEQ